MKRFFLTLAAALVCLASPSAKAETVKIHFDNRTVVTFGKSVTCPSGNGGCSIEVGIDRNGRITITVDAIEVSNDGFSGTAEEIANQVADILQADGNLQVAP